MKDRNVRILDVLAAQKSVKISLLAELLDVSQVTLRKDLDDLEKRSMIRRTHGYASLDDTGKTMALCYSIKKRIAKAAAQIVEEGETLLIESGSCCTLFAEELAVTRKNVTIVTNSVFIANYLDKQQNIKIILLGGYYLPESQVVVGSMTTRFADFFFAEKFFIGTNGFIPGYGFTGKDYLRVETTVELAKRVKNVFVLTESTKFHRRGSYNLIQFDRLTGVFTDESIPKEAETALINNNVLLHKVPICGEKINYLFQ